VTLTLDDETGAYLARMAADQGRTPAEVARGSWRKTCAVSKPSMRTCWPARW